MLKTILLPLDGSRLTGRALPYASTLAVGAVLASCSSKRLEAIQTLTTAGEARVKPLPVTRRG